MVGLQCEGQLESVGELVAVGVDAIDPLDKFGLEHFIWGAGSGHAAVFEHDQFVAVLGGQVQVVQDDQRGHSQAADQGERFVLVADV